MIYYKSRKQEGRQYAHLHVDDIFEVDDFIDEFPEKFVLLLCCDARDYQDSELLKFSENLIENGLCFFEVWGKDSSRFERLCDQKIIDSKLNIATVSYDDETIHEPLSYFINYAAPVEKYQKDCKTWVCITVKNRIWRDAVQKTFTNADS